MVRSDLVAVGDGKKVATQFFDELGRVRLVKTLEDAATQSATNETDGIKVQTRYKTVAGYTYQVSSNPYRANYPVNETDPTMGWTLSTAWSTGRRSEVQTFSGGGLPVAFGGSNQNSTGVVRTDIDANTTVVTDQAGKQRRSVTNALGQLIRVDEPDSSGNLGTIESPTQPTHYYYNTLGKMVRVNQGVQNRYFMHDSLGRLLRVRQPEQTVNTVLNTSGNPDNNSWTIGFSYDNNGNLLTSRDANNVVITSTYDALNRPLTRSYSDSTPTVTYTYDDTANVPFSKGRLTKVFSTVSETRYTEYDEMGRLEKSEQRTDGEVYPSEYKYNLAGMLVEQTYPSGRVVKNVLDASGDISMIQSKRNENFGFHNYAKHFTYNAAGAVTSMQLGNGLWGTAQFNSRLQSTQLGLGALPTGANLWKVDYEFGELQTNGTVDTVKNSGNIAKQTLTVPGTSFVQSYTYDSLYRLTEATEKTGTTTNWSQQFGYDRYGNRTSFAQDIGGIAKNTTPAVDPNTNRFTSTDFGYDANGNIVEDIDEITSLPREFIFNGDNKQTEVKRDGVTIGRYYYDGEGRRVKKVTDTETTVFVYAAGQLIAEYSTAISQTPSVSYTTSDHLGSPRVITNELGQVSSRRDFMPFGEELYAGVGGRTGDTGLKYSSAEDDIRQKFTGYERDIESSLDFAEARMYNFQHGRFTAVDPVMMTKARLADPQAINLYVYTRNNPLKYIDPTGEYFVGTDGKRVDVTVKDGMLRVGQNASKDLQRMARLINDNGSRTSMSQFMSIAGNDTKVNFKIETNPQKDRPGLLGLHQAHDKDGKALNWEANTGGTGKFDGTPAYIKDKDGNQIYQESTITIFEGNIENSLGGLRQGYQDAELTTQEYMVATFGHEGDHNTNQEAINAIRDRQEGRTNNFNVETPAYRVTDQALREIRENRRLPGCFVF